MSYIITRRKPDGTKSAPTLVDDSAKVAEIYDDLKSRGGEVAIEDEDGREYKREDFGA